MYLINVQYVVQKKKYLTRSKDSFGYKTRLEKFSFNISRIKETLIMVRYICEVCDHLDDLNLDDPGIPFDDLPEDWTCPTCGAGKVDFNKET